MASDGAIVFYSYGPVRPVDPDGFGKSGITPMTRKRRSFHMCWIVPPYLMCLRTWSTSPQKIETWVMRIYFLLSLGRLSGRTTPQNCFLACGARGSQLKAWGMRHMTWNFARTANLSATARWDNQEC